MADINASLKEALNGKAPQHKKSGSSTFELSEGSDGALHTKVLDDNGEVIDPSKVEVTNQQEFPTDYPDSAVKAELQAIKQQQADILSRLDNPIETQLTGSNAEFRELTISNSDLLAAGKDEIIDVYSNQGEIWTIVRFGFEINRSSGSAGEHQLSLYHGASMNTSNYIAQLKNASSNFLRGTVPGYFGNEVSEHTPADRAELVESIRNTTILSDILPLRIRLRNMSDADMGFRRFRIFYYVEKVV